MRQYFPRLLYDPYQLHARGLGFCLFFLVSWSLICYQDGYLMALLKVHCPKSISVTILTSNAWEDSLSYLSGGAPLIPGTTFLGDDDCFYYFQK